MVKQTSPTHRFRQARPSPRNLFKLIMLILAVGLLAGCGKDSMTGSDDDNNGDNEIPVFEDAATINFSEEHQIIRGFGGATVFRLNAELTDNDMDLLFGNDPGQIGLAIHRIRVVSDDDPNGRAIELDNALRAKARGAIIIASPWSPPARMKTDVPDVSRPLVGGRLDPDFYDDYATYLNNFAEYMADNGAELYAISIQNEPDIQVGYESCDWTPAEMTNFLRDHGDKITATRVIAPESFQFKFNTTDSISDSILLDPGAEANVDIIGGHIYGGGLEYYPLAHQKGKEVWMTEHLIHDADWGSALTTGIEIHESMTVANYSAYLWWYLRRFYGPISSNLSPNPADKDDPKNEELPGDAMVTNRGYVMSHFAKFIRPGYHRVDTTEPNTNGVLLSAYTGEKDVIVIINNSFAQVELTLTVQNVSSTEVTPHHSTSEVKFQEGDPISISDNSFTHTVPPNSITTLEGN